jgi:hypothetical protein
MMSELIAGGLASIRHGCMMGRTATGRQQQKSDQNIDHFYTSASLPAGSFHYSTPVDLAQKVGTQYI